MQFQLLQVLFLPVGQNITCSAQHQIRKSFDGVHRRAEFVRHRREEGGLSVGLLTDLTVGSLELPIRDLQPSVPVLRGHRQAG